MADFGLDLATYIGAQHASLDLAVNIFDGPMRAVSDAVPAKAVFCLAGGGPPPEPYMDGTAIEERFLRCQIMVRGLPGEGDVGATQTLAREVLALAHRAPLSGYIDVYVEESQPNYLGPDDDEHPLWSINVAAWRDE